MKKFVCMLIGGLIIQLCFAQGPISGFMGGRGNTDFALSYAQESYQVYFFGEEEQAIDNQINSISLFVEHAFTDTLSVVASIPWVKIDEINQGLQDAVLALKYRNQYSRFNTGSFSLITAVGVSFPMSNYPIDTERPIGIKATTFQGRFLGQYNSDQGWFLHLQTGIDFRIIPSAQSAVPILFRTGYGSRLIYVDAWLESFTTFNAGTDAQIAGGAGSIWLKTGGTFYYAIRPKLGLNLSVARFLSGQNIGLATRWSAGFVYRIL